MLSLALSAGSIGCTGTIDGGAGGANSTPSLPQRVPLRQLTPAELDYALTDLLHDDTHLATRLQPTRIFSGIETLPSDESAWVDSRSDALVETMYAVAFRATVNDMQLASCVSSTGDACVTERLNALALRAYRRSLTGEELARFMHVVTALEAETGRQEAIARAVQALLLTPDFLYLTAEGDHASGDDVSPSELASRLAFFLWASLPDEPLLAAAARGDLSDAALREREVRRMLDDPRSGRAMARFVLGWTEAITLNQMTKADPMWTSALAQDAVGETDAFVQDWFRTDGNGFEQLLTIFYRFNKIYPSKRIG